MPAYPASFYGRVLLTGGLLSTAWGLILTLTSTDIRKILMGLNVAVNGFKSHRLDTGFYCLLYPPVPAAIPLLLLESS